jgi:hypothetical protein
MISAAGVAAVRAVSMVDSLNIFLVNVFIAVATGGTVIVAQYKGSGNPEMVSKKPCHFFFPRSLIIKNSSILFSKGTFVFMI